MHSRRPSAQDLPPKPGLPGHIGKCAIAIVAVEPVLSEVGAEDVVEAVVVVVGDANSIGPACRLQAGLFGDVRESAVTVIFVQAVRRFGRIAVQARSRKQKNIHPAIIVVINEGASATIGLQDVFLRSTPP